MKITKITEFKDNKYLTSNQKSIVFYEPKQIYLPFVDNNEQYNSLVKLNDYVKIGQKVLISENSKIYLHSSISGYVTDLNKKMWTSSGKLISCIEIENDYKNESVIETEINPLTRQYIINKIQECGIVGMGGAGFPTYKKYLNNNLDILIVNCCECEPFITCDYRIIVEKTKKLIDGIKYVLKAINSSKAYIAIKEDKNELINILYEYEDENIKIFIVKDKYPVGYERYLVEKITRKKYGKLPSEVNCVVNNPSTILAIHDAIKSNIPLIHRLVTFTGYCLKNPINVHCKIGTPVNEVINNICGIKHKYLKKHLIAGGVMTEKSSPSDNLIVNKSINSVIFNPFLKNMKNIKVCIGCGKCSEICPMKLTPTEIQKEYSNNNVDSLLALKAILCIQCGLCSYVCPSRIELTYFTGKAREFIRKVKK